MSGTAADISMVHWRQQWLENGTLYFHVSMSSSGQLARATATTLQEPSEIVEEQMHILHISVMVSAGRAVGVGREAKWWRDERRQRIVCRWQEIAGQVQEVIMIISRSCGFHCVTWTDAYLSIICQL
jgi:hypothetical protein